MMVETNGMVIVTRIDEILSRNGKSRVDLCNELGIKTQTISHWYTRGSVPKADDAVKIAHYLGVSVEFLIFGVDEADEAIKADEAHLLRRWRALSDSEKAGVDALISGYENARDSAAEKKA